MERVLESARQKRPSPTNVAVVGMRMGSLVFAFENDNSRQYCMSALKVLSAILENIQQGDISQVNERDLVCPSLQ